MLGIKKKFIKNMIKLEVVSNIPGELQIYVAQIKKVEEPYKVYESYAEKALVLLRGVQSLQVDYDKGVATIKYDIDKVKPRRIYAWLQTMVNLGIDIYDELKPMWETDEEEKAKVEAIWQKVKPILISNVNKV